MKELIVIQFLLLSAAVLLSACEKYGDAEIVEKGSVHVGAGRICYEPYGTNVVPEYEVSNLLISVNWIDEDEDGADAWSECEVDVEKDIGWCEIWVKRPTSVLGDPDMDALGHEVLHGLIGDFHPEDNE